MKTIPLSSWEQYQDDLKEYIFNNNILLYPTDSLYGLGALWTKENIQTIAIIKNRPEDKKMNIIAPSWKRIEEHFHIHNKDFLEAHYNQHHATTFILEPKSPEVMLYKTMYGEPTVGVRILKHPIQHLFSSLNIPFITTSANMGGESNIKSVDQLSPRIVPHVGYCIDGGEVTGIPSVLVFDCTKEIVIRR